MSKLDIDFTQHINGKLNNHPAIRQLVNNSFAEKVNIQTLTTITTNFLNKFSNDQYLKEVLTFSSDQYQRSPIDFEFDGKIWTATITKQLSPYFGINTQFINIKLPNDCFIFTPADLQGIFFIIEFYYPHYTKF
jgi:hypothetical protein